MEVLIGIVSGIERQ